ncbi:MAG: DUF4215 domain-containing protein [Deltaproteobacteria bacterium]|nr:DUF4215 domain-containing protein [Deltaproteobacteria bacterium]MBI3389162.1 DUF4215 domain-containing protein [Deltaproteobacteria bacterium]
MKKTLVRVAQLASFVLLVPAPPALAQSSSASFRMTSEALNTGGGRSNSASFSLSDCLPPAPEAGGTSSSSSFQMQSGCGSALTQAVCGNGVVEFGEQCDDGNTLNGDGCSATCSTETGYSCAGSPSVCNAICGDGFVTGVEQCDDGNTNPDDGCSATCAVEPDHTCIGSPSVCTCGTNPACIAGQRCVSGSCVCDNTSCPNGCCAGSTCTVPSPTSCGAGGASCLTCDTALADTCTNGACACGAGPACAAGERCMNGVCIQGACGNGILDPTFGSGGKVVTALGSFDDEANAVVLQPDGKLVAAGDWAPDQNQFHFLFTIVRYNVNGSLDTTFDSVEHDGIVTTFLDGSAQPRALVLQPDGKLVAAGAEDGPDNLKNIALVRYESTGTLDTSFGNGGIVRTDIGAALGVSTSDGANALVLQSDGKLVAAGFTNRGGPADFVLVRYNPNGSLDTSFGNNGIVISSISDGDDRADALLLQPDGKLVAAGYGGDNAKKFALARYNSDGSLDSSFGSGGKVITPIGTDEDIATALLRQPDGKLVAAGGSFSGGYDRFALVRYNSDGGLDTAFGVGGEVTTATASSHSSISAIVEQSDGKLVGVGHISPAAGADSALVRYDSNGNLDSSFGCNGIVTTMLSSEPDASDEFRSVLLQPDGRLVAAGAARTGAYWNYALARYLMNGAPTCCACGNGILDTGEQCDDGSTASDDGCSATCVTETGWSCSGQPSVCTPICGDGLLRGSEECDDGNTTSGDCCSSTCQIEAPNTVAAYVTNGQSGTVSVINTMTNSVVATVTVGSNPEGVAVGPNAALVYVANQVSAGMSVINTSTNFLAATVGFGNGSHMVAITPDGARAYVTTTSSGVFVLDTATNGVVATTPVFPMYDIAITPDGASAYVTEGTSGFSNVRVVDTASNTVTATIPAGVDVVGIAISPDGSRAYATNANAAATVTVIDTGTKSVVGTIPVGVDPLGVAFSPNGAIAYVANGQSSGTVSVIDTAASTVIATIPVGQYPAFVAFTPDGSAAYVTNRVSDTVSVVDTATNTVSATIPVGSFPLGVAVAAVCVRADATVTPTEPTATLALTPTVTATGGPPTAAATGTVTPTGPTASVTPAVTVPGTLPTNTTTAAPTKTLTSIPTPSQSPVPSATVPGTLPSNTTTTAPTKTLTNTATATGSPTATGTKSPTPTVNAAATLTATTTATASGTPTTTQTIPAGCGNGVRAGNEECDDGNRIDGDGCDANCTLPRCGNGRVVPPEQCDDGNSNPADGCTNDCTVCGDGIVSGSEQCDDGNRNDFDGCTNACTACGDGLLRLGEQCDDGNANGNDGCAANCRYELIPGNGVGAKTTNARACLLEFSVVNPNNVPRLDRNGRLNSTQTCRNGDATCDLGSDPLACEFRVAVCVNNLDPQLSSCTPQGVRAGLDVRFGGIDIVLPIASRDPMNYTSLYQALRQFRDPNTGDTLSLPIDSYRTDVCTDVFAIRVPLRIVGTRQFLGRVLLRTITRAQDTSPIPVMIDLDGLTLVCKP